MPPEKTWRNWKLWLPLCWFGRHRREIWDSYEMPMGTCVTVTWCPRCNRFFRESIPMNPSWENLYDDEA